MPVVPVTQVVGPGSLEPLSSRPIWAAQYIKPSLKEKGLVGWGYSLETLENSQFQLTGKEKQLEEQFRI